MGTQNGANDQHGYGLILWLVWGALLFSVFIYALSSLVIPAPEGFEPLDMAAGTPPMIVVILGLGSVALVPILNNVRQRMFFGLLGDDLEPGAEEAHRAYFTMALTTWVMCELVGIFGYVVYFLTYEPLYALPFIALAGLMLLVYRPQPDRADGAA